MLLRTVKLSGHLGLISSRMSFSLSLKHPRLVIWRNTSGSIFSSDGITWVYDKREKRHRMSVFGSMMKWSIQGWVSLGLPHTYQNWWGEMWTRLITINYGIRAIVTCRERLRIYGRNGGLIVWVEFSTLKANLAAPTLYSDQNDKVYGWVITPSGWRTNLDNLGHRQLQFQFDFAGVPRRNLCQWVREKRGIPRRELLHKNYNWTSHPSTQASLNTSASWKEGKNHIEAEPCQ